MRPYNRGICSSLETRVKSFTGGEDWASMLRASLVHEGKWEEFSVEKVILHSCIQSERGRENLRKILQRAVELKHVWMYCVFLCVSEREWCQHKSHVGNTSAGPCLPWEYLAAFMHVFYECWGHKPSIPKHPSGFVWRLNWSRRRTKLDGDWPSGMLIIFLTRSSSSYKICCYYRSAVVIIGRFSVSGVFLVFLIWYLKNKLV